MARILIVDDHTLVRQGLREILADGFAEAVFGEAGNVDEMLGHLRGGHWDVIILDIGMPGRSGLDLFGPGGRLSPWTPVLLRTMNPARQNARGASGGGAAGYITKDAVAEELLRAVQVLLEGGKYVSPPVAAFLVTQITAGEGKPSYEALSGREYEVFRALVAGQSVTAIAKQLGLSSKTVSTYRVRLYEKLGVKTLVELTRYAMEHGLIVPAPGRR